MTRAMTIMCVVRASRCAASLACNVPQRPPHHQGGCCGCTNSGSRKEASRIRDCRRRKLVAQTSQVATGASCKSLPSWVVPGVQSATAAAQLCWPPGGSPAAAEGISKSLRLLGRGSATAMVGLM